MDAGEDLRVRVLLDIAEDGRAVRTGDLSEDSSVRKGGIVTLPDWA
jgi:hypothetical protein